MKSYEKEEVITLCGTANQKEVSESRIAINV